MLPGPKTRVFTSDGMMSVAGLGASTQVPDNVIIVGLSTPLPGDLLFRNIHQYILLMLNSHKKMNHIPMKVIATDISRSTCYI